MGRIWDHNFNACPGKRVQMQALIGVKMFGRGWEFVMSGDNFSHPLELLEQTAVHFISKFLFLSPHSCL